MKLTKERLVEIINEEMSFYEAEGPGPTAPTVTTTEPQQPDPSTAEPETAAPEKEDSGVIQAMKMVNTKILNAKQYSQFLQMIMKYNAGGKITDAQKITVLRNLKDLLLAMVGGKEAVSE